MPKAQSDSRWFPSRDQLDSPEKLERAFRQMLTQHYSLVDRQKAAGATTSSAPASSPQGPTNTMICGLRVTPVDTQSLADGTKLTFDKKNGVFTFK